MDILSYDVVEFDSFDFEAQLDAQFGEAAITHAPPNVDISNPMTADVNVWDDFSGFSVLAETKAIPDTVYNEGEEDDDDQDDGGGGGGVFPDSWTDDGYELIAYFSINDGSMGSFHFDGSGGGGGGGTGPSGTPPITQPDTPDTPTPDDPDTSDCPQVTPSNVNTNAMANDSHALANEANALTNNFLRAALLHGSSISTTAPNGTQISLFQLVDFAASGQSVNFFIGDLNTSATTATVGGANFTTFDLNEITSNGNFGRDFLTTLVHELLHIDSNHDDYGLNSESALDDIANDLIKQLEDATNSDLTDTENNDCDG
ncbi:hypothetical protein [Fretibacter rubidus]|uniref:hypothetical protein n=1 Tax=Fretibacter rubidus TaxID=570162 RepID=UPI00352ACC44